MSNHFTGLSLGPPLGDQRLDLCDLYAFQSPTDGSRTVLILNANPQADALHPDAIYRLAIDTDGDLINDVAFSFVFSTPVDGRQTVDVFLARGERSRSPEPVGEQILTDVQVSFGAQPNVATAGDITFAAAGGVQDGFRQIMDMGSRYRFRQAVDRSLQRRRHDLDDFRTKHHGGHPKRFIVAAIGRQSRARLPLRKDRRNSS